MKLFQIILCMPVFLLQAKGILTCQENIMINDSLATQASILEVDAEYYSGNNQKFTMGEYSIAVEPEMSGIYSKTKEKLMGERIVTDVTKAFSFSVCGNTTDTAEVYSEEVYRTNIYHPNAVLENFLLEESTSTKFKSFAAWITFKGDSSTTWTLYVPERKGNDNKFIFEMLLTDGVKYINVTSVSSDMYFDYSHPLKSMLKMPAMGFEFFDNGKSICAVQYDTGAANSFDMGQKQSFGCKAWMDQQLDPKTRLVMASAMAMLVLLRNPYMAMSE